MTSTPTSSTGQGGFEDVSGGSQSEQAKSLPQMRYQRFDYDSSVVDGEEYKERLLNQGWQELESSKEIEEHSWPLNYDRFNTHRDINIESFTLKRLEQVNDLQPSDKDVQ